MRVPRLGPRATPEPVLGKEEKPIAPPGELGEGAACWADVARDLPTLPIEFQPADRELADLAADFKSRFSLSLADAVAAALARKHKAGLVTGDPEFKTMEKEIRINWLK